MIAVLDIGGTSIKYGVISAKEGSGRLLEQGSSDSNARRLGGPGIVEKVTGIVQRLRRTYQIEGIAVSTAGMVDAESGTILYANENIPQYTGTELKRILEERFHVPCWVENDVNAAALGEYCHGAAKGTESMLMLTIGTGIGGAVVLGGDVYRGYSKSAGEIGYMWVDGHHFQEIASTTALVARVEQASGQTGMDGRAVFERARQGDEVCSREIRVLCSHIAKGISNCVCLLNPQIVVLGGGIMSQSEYLGPILKRYADEFMNEEMRKHTRIDFARLENTAGMVGAYVYFMKRYQGQKF